MVKQRPAGVPQGEGEAVAVEVPSGMDRLDACPQVERPIRRRRPGAKRRCGVFLFAREGHGPRPFPLEKIICDGQAEPIGILAGAAVSGLFGELVE
jgi:hypothetical protein